MRCDDWRGLGLLAASGLVALVEIDGHSREIVDGDTFVAQQVTTRGCRCEPACPGEITMLARTMKLDAEAAV